MARSNPATPRERTRADVVLFNCPRCSKTHVGINPNPFIRPSRHHDTEFTHWILCPETNEPVMLTSKQATAEGSRAKA